MTSPVVDASVALAWLFDDEQDDRADAAIAVMRREGGIVPQHWHYEVRNGLLMAVRRGRLTLAVMAQQLQSLYELTVSTDLDSDLEAVMSLALEHRLTFYDALYLELALRRQLLLATLDDDLIAAARRSGVNVVSA